MLIFEGNNIIARMLELKGLPKNKERFIRLIDFFKEVLDIIVPLNINPIIDGGLAVFAYTANKDLVVNDIDASVSESEFPRIIKALNENGISYSLKEWHVLQVFRDDLKIDFGSLEYWLKDTPPDLETLQIDKHEVNVLSLSSLKKFYKQAMEDRAKGKSPNDKIKYERLKSKYEELLKL